MEEPLNPAKNHATPATIQFSTSTPLINPAISSSSLPPPVIDHTKDDMFTHSFLFLYSFVVVTYFILGTFVFYYFEKDWTIFDSFYFVMITFLTIGFGDFYPTCGVTKIFICFYIFLGLTIIASGVKYIFDFIAEKNQQLQQDGLLKRLKFEAQIATDSLLTTHTPPRPSQSTPTVIQNFLMKQMKLSKSLSTVYEDIVIAILIVVVNISIGILCHRYLFDKLPLIDSIYLSVVTITTLGYGDLVPRTTSSRGFTILYAFVGVISTAKAVSLVNDARSKFIISYRTEKELVARDVDLEQHEFFDKNEFVLYKLTKMGIITPDLRSHIEELFTAMDVNKSGILSNHDILKFSDLIHRDSVQRDSSTMSSSIHERPRF